jgi:hypothetical protein
MHLSNHSEFRAASEAAERWADQLVAFCYSADLSLPVGSDISQGERTKLACEKLSELKDEFSRHGPALDAAKDQVAALDNALYTFTTPFGKRSYPSMHEGVFDLTRIAALAAEPPNLGEDQLAELRSRVVEQYLCRFLKEFPARVSEVKAAIRCERARMLAHLHVEPGVKEKLEKAIAKLGEDAKSTAILKEARVERTRGLKVLRVLEEEGKYETSR